MISGLSDRLLLQKNTNTQQIDVKNMNCTAIIPAGGKGKRFGSDMPKQFIELNGLPIIVHTLKLFQEIEEVNSIVVPVHSDFFKLMQELAAEHGITKAREIVIGGNKRQESVYNALQTKSVEDADIVLVHDAVRPLVSAKLVKNIIEAADEYGAAVPAVELPHVLKERTSTGSIVKTIDKNKLCSVQTPQGFWQELIVTAYKKANEVGYIGPDSSSLLEFIGYKVQAIEGEESNIKIITPLDTKVAEMIMNGGV